LRDRGWFLRICPYQIIWFGTIHCRKLGLLLQAHSVEVHTGLILRPQVAHSRYGIVCRLI